LGIHENGILKKRKPTKPTGCLKSVPRKLISLL
jgi:hypothetical protein